MLGIHTRRKTRASLVLGVVGGLVAMVVALPAPADAAGPACPTSYRLDDVHSGGSVVGQLSCDDPGGTGLSYGSGSEPHHGTVYLDGSGGVVYYADADYAGTDSWTVTVSDNEGGSTDVDVSVDVVNQAPVCHAVDLGSTPHDQAAFGLPQCTDPDGDALDYHAQPAAHGTSGASSGYLSYTPDTGYVGADSFLYGATDGVTTSAPVEATVTVQNDAPTCDDGNEQTLRTGKAITLRVSCHDTDGDILTVARASGPDHGTLGAFSYDAALDTFEATYTPDGGYTGADTFTFTASDDLASSPAYAFDLTVTPNHAPVCETAQTTHAKVGQQVELYFFACYDSDAQDAELSYSITDPPGHGTTGTVGTYSVTYTPQAGYVGTDDLGLEASDGDLASTYTQHLHVADTPFCSAPPPVALRPGASRALSVDCTIPPGDFGSPHYEIGTAPTKGTLSPNGSSFSSVRTYTAGADSDGVDSYTVRLTSDTTGSSPPVTQTITIGSAVDNDPVCEPSGPATVYAGRPTALFPFCSDPDGDELTYAAGAHPEHGTSSTSGNHLVYTADTGYIGADAVPFTVSDGHGGSATASQPVQVHAPEAPTCNPVTLTARPGTSRSIQLACSNPQGDPQTYTVVTPPSQGTLSAIDHDGAATYTARADASGTDTFTVRADDAVGPGDPVTITVHLDPDFNRAPTCASNAFDRQAVATGTTTALDLDQVCSDADGDPLQFVRQSSPAHGSVGAGSASVLTYTSDPGYTGADSFTFTATDGRSTSAVTTYFVSVVDSVAPTCTPGPVVVVTADSTAEVSLDCQDPNLEQVTYRIIRAPAGTLAPAGDSTNPTRSYTAPHAAGPDSFTYQAVSAGGESPVYTQDIQVEPGANAAPSCDPVQTTAAAGKAVIITLDCTDPDGDPLTYSTVSGPGKGTVSAVTGAHVTYTPGDGAAGTDTFTYRASDGTAESAPATVTIEVTQPPAPVPTPDTTAPRTTVSVAAQRLKAVLARGLAVRVVSSELSEVRVELVVDKRTARRLGLGRSAAVVGTLVRSISDTTTLKVRLTRKATRALGKARSVQLTVRAVATDPAGNVGRPVATRVTVRR